MKSLAVEKSNKVFINCEDIDFVGITVNDLTALKKPYTESTNQI